MSDTNGSNLRAMYGFGYHTDPTQESSGTSNDMDSFMQKIAEDDESKIIMGEKVTGRYGGKGVIKSIIPDTDLPVTEDGSPVNMVPFMLSEAYINARRKYLHIDEQFAEVNLTSIVTQIVNRMKSLSTPEERFDVLVEFQNIFDPDYARMLITHPEDNSFKKDITDSIIVSGTIYTRITDLSKLPDLIDKAYEKFDWLDKDGLKESSNQTPGQQYIMKLKDNSTRRTK